MGLWYGVEDGYLRLELDDGSVLLVAAELDITAGIPLAQLRNDVSKDRPIPIDEPPVLWGNPERTALRHCRCESCPVHPSRRHRRSKSRAR